MKKLQTKNTKKNNLKKLKAKASVLVAGNTEIYNELSNENKNKSKINRKVPKSKTIAKRKVTTAPKTSKSKSDKNIISKPPEDFYTKLYRAFNDSTSNDEDDNDYLDFIRIK
ncbi:hypothetical protein A0H76_582 [Hepatospora eriocheir]|uniref:Uncharacterized protein n=1 Tax=Hepatospora eriocheir TaxID=1081669 RepID=A0A1X0QII9_9MICR|nr:hypothetical protein A0H76_582 [Hepatospora eriocheir]